jgi:hypothetical protein
MLALPLLMAPDSITLNSLTANPNNNNGQIKGEGSYSVDPTRSEISVSLHCRSSTTQQVYSAYSYGLADEPNWYRIATNLPAPDTYDCWAILKTLDQNMMIHTRESNGSGVFLPQ